MNPVPSAKATSLRRFLSITMFLECSVEEDSSSDVIRRMIAMTASQRLTSDMDRGKFIFYPSMKRCQTSIVCPSGDILSRSIVTIFPVVLAIAHVIALMRGHPRKCMLFKFFSRL